jgi:hypothetical protein
MSILETIFENEDFKNYMTENTELLTEAETAVEELPKILKSFVLANPTEFIGENLDQTKKNIKVFTEVATCQYIQELSSVMAEQLKVEEDANDTNLEENELIKSYL